MFKQHRKSRVLCKRTLMPLLLGLFGVVSIMGSFLLTSTKTANAVSNNNTVNFQARLQTSSGALVPDGYYNVEFKLYDEASGDSSSQGTCSGDSHCLWVETRQDSGTDNRVRVVDGYLSVQLGSVNSFPSTINWNQPLWLTMNIGGSGTTATWDGEMNPRIALTAVPSSLSAEQLASVVSGFQEVLQFSNSPSSNITINIPKPDSGSTGTICLQNSTSCGFVTSGGLSSSAFVQSGNSFGTTALLGTNDNFGVTVETDGHVVESLSNTGAATFTNFSNSATAFQVQNAGGGNTIFDVDTSNKRVGINTTAPQSALDVNGGVAIGSYAGTTAAPSNGLIVSGNVGIGVSNPGSALSLANGAWLSALNAAGTSYINLFSLNSNNEIQAGAAISVDGGIILPTDGGQLTFSDLPIDSSASSGTPESYTFRVGSTNALTVYGQSNGSGGVQNVRVAVGSSIAPAYTLDVGGDVNISSGSVYRINGTPICTSSGCTASSGSGNYIQNSASVQSANFFVQSASSGTVAAKLQANASGSADILDLLNGSGVTVGSFGSTGSVLVKPSTNSTTAFQIQPASSSTPVFDVDTTNGRIGVNNNTPAYALDVNGDINSNTAVRVGGISVCTVSDCVPASGSNNYIQNGTTTQTAANFSVRSAATNAVTGVLQGASGQTSDILDIQSWNGTSATTLDSFAANGNFSSIGTGTFTTNSISAFQVQNASGSSGVLLNADTTNMRIDIGTAGTSTGQLYVSGSAPSGVLGSVSTGSNSLPFSVYVQGNYAYVANNGLSALGIYDISNPADPVSVGSVSTGSTSYPEAVYVQGDYAYVVETNINTLGIYDISNPADPVSVGSVSTGAGSNPTSVYVSGAYVYVTSQSTGELNIFNISNPADPVSVGSAGSIYDPTSVYVQGHYAYVGEPDSSALGIYDISNPADPVSVGNVSTGTNGPLSVYVQGSYAYVTIANSYTLNIYDISNPADPVSVGNVSTGTGQPDSVFVQGRYAYVADYNDSSLNIYDISNPADPVSVGNVSTGSTSGPQSVFVQGRYAYVAAETANSLEVFDLGGTYTQQLQAGGTETGTLQVDSNANVGGDENINGGLTVGGSTSLQGGLAVSGSATVTSNNSLQNSATLSIQNAGTGDATQEFSASGSTYFMGIDTSNSTFNVSSKEAASSTANVGYQTIGAQSGIVNDNILASEVTTGASASSSQSISLYISTLDTFGQTGAQVAIYSNNSGSPGTLLGSTSTATPSATGWLTVPISVTLAPNTSYWIAYETQEYDDVNWDSGVSGSFDMLSGVTYGTWPASPTGWTTTSSNLLSLYMTYYNSGISDDYSNSLFSMTATGQTKFENATNSTTAFQIQTAAGTAILTVDTTDGTVVVGSGSNTITLNPNSGATASGSARHTKKIVLTAEYAGAVLDNGGASSDVGTMTAGYDSTQKENYYQWTTTQSTNQTYDIVVQIPIPSDFSAWASNDPLTVDINTSSTSNGTVTGTLLDTSGAAVANWNTCALTPTVTGWVTSGAGATHGATCNITTGTWTAGAVATLRLHLQAPTSGTTEVGNITLSYLSSF